MMTDGIRPRIWLHHVPAGVKLAGLALLGLVLLGLGLLAAEPLGFDHGVAEHLHRARHLADFVGAVGVGDRRVELAFAERGHAVLQAGQRLHDAAGYEPGDPDR